VIAACQTTQAVVGNQVLAYLQSPDPPPLEGVLPLFINDLVSMPQPFALVLDDYHTITESAIHRTLRWFLDRLPPSLHLVITSRTDPPLALARRRVCGELSELRAADLRFGPEEVEEWFTRVQRLPLSATQIAHLQARTEGWAAALHLAMLSLRRSADLSQALANFTGSHRYVMDYLVEEVLAYLSEEARSFLLRTAFLERFTGSLCDAVTGRSDGQTMLESLERAGLFLQPLDGQRRWYRYHQLFAEVLQISATGELGQEQCAILARRACAWYEDHGLLLEAMETALAAADYDTVIRIGTALVPRLLLSGQHATVAHWIKLVPRVLLFSQPLLCIALAWTQLLSGQDTVAEIPLREAEQRLTQLEDRQGLGVVATLRALLARLQHDGSAAVRWGQQALSLLEADARIPRSASALALGYGYRLQGEIALARETLVEARLLSEQVGNTTGILGSTLQLGQVQELEGRLVQAADCYRLVIGAQQVSSPPLIEAHLALGALLLEWNELDGAAAQLERALVLSHQWEQTSFVAQTALLQARVQQAKVAEEPIEEAFLRAVILARQSKSSLLLRRALAYQTRWWLIQGNLEAARTFRTTCGLTGEEAPTFEQEETMLTLARVLLALGEAASVRQLVERWRAFAAAQGRVGSQVEMLVLLARAADAQGHIPEAVSLLHQALLLAEEGRYRQLFVREGPALPRLLHLLQPRWRGKAGAAYLEYLLQAMSMIHPASPSPGSAKSPMPLLSPLTPREYKVLRLLAAGLSTREIASELVVSLNTVKTQIQSLYRKLDARSRETALATARAFQLL